MKKILFLLIIILLPIIVYAETCDNSNIVISDIVKVDSNGYVEEINSPLINNQSVSTNLKLYDVGDSITYNFKIRNNSKEDYDLSKEISGDEYCDYEIISDNNKIKSGEEKTISLRITYKNRVDDSLFKGNKYIQEKELSIVLGDSIINPNTGFVRLIIVLFIMLVIITSSLIVIEGNKKYLSLLVLLFIPLFVKATCQYRFFINSNIEYKKIVPNPCTYEGELEPGVEYVNGQYTYSYMNEWDYDLGGEFFRWFDMNNDGWGVVITDKYSTDPVTTPLCTSINGKPIVSMKSMFWGSNATSIDLSSFDTSNVVNMNGMFIDSEALELDLSGFDTSKVTDMGQMFWGSDVSSLDLSSFDTSNVTNMSYMFTGCSSESIDLSSFNTSNVTDMSYMFSDSLVNTLDLRNFDTSKVTDMSYMFEYNNATLIDVSSFNTSNVTDMYFMFYNVNVDTLNLSSFNFSNVSNGLGTLEYRSGDINVITKSEEQANYLYYNSIYENYRINIYVGSTLKYVVEPS